MDLSKATAEYLAEFKFKDWWEVRNYKKCIEHLELMTKKGEADTSLLWGMCYRDGLGVKKDKAKARQYFESVSVGSTVYFGINSVTHKLLKSTVLDIKDGKALLCTDQLYPYPSTYASQKLFTPNGVISTWLNDKSDISGFIYKSFTKPEKARLVETLVTTPDNPYCTSGWVQKDFKAKVFLLSVQEYLHYNWLDDRDHLSGQWTFFNEKFTYAPNGEKIVQSTFSKKFDTLCFGEYPDEGYLDDKTCIFTRTPGEKKDSHCFVVNDIVFPQGTNYEKIPFSDVKIAYKPAFWINLE